MEMDSTRFAYRKDVSPSYCNYTIDRWSKDPLTKERCDEIWHQYLTLQCATTRFSGMIQDLNRLSKLADLQKENTRKLLAKIISK